MEINVNIKGFSKKVTLRFFRVSRLENRRLSVSSGNFCQIWVYNNKTLDFRTALLRQHQVDAIFDFVSIRNLYDGADPKTVAILAKFETPTDAHRIQHWTFRRTISVHERLCFEIDYYDRHAVPQTVAESNTFVWRTNLLGGGRLHSFSQRMRSLRTLKQFIDYNIRHHGWDYGEGFIAAMHGKREPAPFLTKRPLLSADAFTEKGIRFDKLTIVNETYFRSAYTEKRYSAPLILIKELNSLPMDYVESGFLAYKGRIVGIHAPTTQVEELHTLYQQIRSHHSSYQLLLSLHGTEALVGQATSIRKQDIDLLPYPDNSDELILSSWEEALRDEVLNYMTDYIRLGQESTLLSTTADIEAMRVYSDQFLSLLGSVYENLHANEPIFLGGLICQSFYFGESPLTPWLMEGREEALKTLIYQDKQQQCLRTVRMLRFYADNALLLVKPDRLRYWIRSTAIRDADDTLTDLYRWGY